MLSKANGINEMIVNTEKSSFSRVMLTVRRLVRTEKTVIIIIIIIIINVDV